MLVPSKHKENDYPLKDKKHVFKIGWEKVCDANPGKRTCIDIGAHIGVYALEYAKHFKHVYAFEPIDHIYKMLYMNTMNTDNITTYNYPVGNDNDVTMMTDSLRTEMSFIIDSDNGNPVRANLIKDREEVSVIEKKRALSIDSFKFKDVDFIKIDTDGYVIPILEGAKETIDRWSPVMQIEIISNQVEITNWLDKMGYQSYNKVREDFWFKRREK